MSASGDRPGREPARRDRDVGHDAHDADLRRDAEARDAEARRETVARDEPAARDETVVRDEPVGTRGHQRTVVRDRVRGGVSMWSVLSGVLVAFGAFVVLLAIIGAILAALGVAQGGVVRPGEASAAGIGAGIGVVVTQLLAYMWGGYTAGRMARGAGVVNGLLVPIVALIVIAILGAILAAVTGATGAAVDVQQLPLAPADLTGIATGVGIALLVAMLLGGVLGGMLGARWHTKLENREVTTRTAT